MPCDGFGQVTGVSLTLGAAAQVAHGFEPHLLQRHPILHRQTMQLVRPQQGVTRDAPPTVGRQAFEAAKVIRALQAHSRTRGHNSGVQLRLISRGQWPRILAQDRRASGRAAFGQEVDGVPVLGSREKALNHR
ncbi:Uncharacterised protein [Pseudomonas synxantha]|uniref:Uncharacterized protein n=1 Tax=Pseudomonas synxantha TaxID=47883 RepID=A0AAX3IAM1_9PSED|nr:Uncharacterised protein [Pseudomonas synxantha]